MLLIFKPLQSVGTFLLRLIFTDDVDGVFLLIERIDFMVEYYAVSEPPNTRVGATRYAI